jgi:hypothetical protein
MASIADCRMCVVGHRLLIIGVGCRLKILMAGGPVLPTVKKNILRQYRVVLELQYKGDK